MSIIRETFTLLCIVMTIILATAYIFYEEELFHYYLVLKNGNSVYQNDSVKLNSKFVSIVVQKEDFYILKLKEKSLSEITITLGQMSKSLKANLFEFEKYKILLDTKSCFAISLEPKFLGDFSLLIQSKYTNYTFMINDMVDKNIMKTLCDEVWV
ncbi:hypothetical protein RI844_03045 [Thalassotalea fonticola]|uniref:Uncharacterized protein n=1 Tax=Thalassotalea fonticola TaxID=3065649 RepID=A0ABZ0GRE6_9GAMM|nr:hypothetical protein RI844_03045 [Colwelliaceae bacterium S1-1]